jgi:hypothetical protein
VIVQKEWRIEMPNIEERERQVHALCRWENEGGAIASEDLRDLKPEGRTNAQNRHDSNVGGWPPKVRTTCVDALLLAPAVAYADS